MTAFLKVRLSALLPLCLLQGCINMAAYPDDWARPDASRTPIEQRISGDYRCHGDTLRPSSHEVIDAGYLPVSLYMHKEVAGVCDRVRLLAADNGTLEVTLFREGDVIGQKTFERGVDYYRNRHWLNFPWQEAVYERQRFFIITGYSRAEQALTLDTAGNLIIRSSFSTATFLLFVPIAGYGVNWSRFERISAPQPPAPAPSPAE